MKSKKTKNALFNRFATTFAAMLCAVLYVCANTNSCLMVHQPEAPTSLRRFSKFE